MFTLGMIGILALSGSMHRDSFLSGLLVAGFIDGLLFALRNS